MKKQLLKKETIDTIKFIGVLIILFVVITLVVTYIPPFNKYNIFAVQTDSMEPIISPGDVVITKEVPVENIEVGDIMAFYVDITGDGEDDVVVHYIDNIREFEEQLIFKTKPHISDQQDSWTIEETDLIGVYQYKINAIGRILLFAQSWIGRIIILIDIIVISVLYDLLFGKKKQTLLNENGDNDNAFSIEPGSQSISVNTVDTMSKIDHSFNEDTIDFHTFTVLELRAYAKSIGLKGYSKLRKTELIQLIEKEKASTS